LKRNNLINNVIKISTNYYLSAPVFMLLTDY